MNDETYTAGEMTNAEIGMKEFAEMEKRPQYFSLFLETCETLSLFDNESAGKVMRAIADYFRRPCRRSQSPSAGRTTASSAGVTRAVCAGMRHPPEEKRAH